LKRKFSRTSKNALSFIQNASIHVASTYSGPKTPLFQTKRGVFFAVFS